MVKEWLAARWPFEALYRMGVEEDIPGGSSYFYSFGSAVLIVFFIQAATGIMQLFFYVPSVEEAYRSVAYLDTKVPFGWLIHGLHYWGAQVIIVLILLHITRVFLWGAYKRPRELTWLAGVALLLVLLAFSLTGATLPWDQKGYWAGQVSTSIAGVLPVAGNLQKVFLRGGEDMGQLTITRFFGLHVAVLPVALMAVFGLHFVAMRRFGVSGPWEEKRRTQSGPFWPDQVLKDAVVGTAVLLILITLVVFVPYEFTGAADRLDSTYVPKPEWNFLFLYEALKYFKGPLEPLGAGGVPAFLVGLFVLLPFIDRNPERNPFRRPVAILSGFALAVIIVALSIAGYLSPGYGASSAGAPAKKAAVSDHLSWDMAETAEAATGASTLLPNPPKGEDAMATSKAVNIVGNTEEGEELFSQTCSPCHGPQGTKGLPNPGSELGHIPALNPINPRLKSSDPVTFAKNINRFILHGSTPNGSSPSVSMPSFGASLSDNKMADIIDYIMKLNGVERTSASGGREEGQPARSSQETQKAVTPKAEVKSEASPQPRSEKAAPSSEEQQAAVGEQPPMPAPSVKGTSLEVGEAAFILGNADRGEVVFKAKCTGCHGEDARGGLPNQGSDDGTVPALNPIGPEFISKNPEEFAKNIDRFIQHGSVPEGPSPALKMLAFGDQNTLTQQQISNVISYIMRLNGADRAEILNPGISPRRFYVIVVGILLVVSLALAGGWSRKSGSTGLQRNREEDD